MKNYTSLLLLILCTTVMSSQNKEKIKGSKTVTIKRIEIGNFTSIEVNDNLEIYLEKGEMSEIKIEADDNLHDVISTDLKDKTLLIYTTKDVVKYKKLIVHVIYNNSLVSINSKNESTVNAIEELLLDKVEIKSFDNSKLFLNANTKDFLLESNDKSKVELNLKSEKSKITLSQDAYLKSLISSDEVIFDMYQKSNAKIEGDCKNAIIRLDNNSNFIGNKFTIKNLDLTTESYSNCTVNASKSIEIKADGKSEIQLIGNSKIEISKFNDEAKLLKKTK